jgi:ribosomal protein S18 acetylase RimI-like enzyme
MHVHVDRASPNDLDDVLPLVTAYRAFYEQKPNVERERELIEKHLREGRSTIFVARSESDRAIGFAQIFQTWSTVWLGPSLIFEDLYVVPEARGSGVATKLLERAIEHAKEIEAAGMFLETAMDNVTAQRVYARAGWSREGRFYKYNAPL